MQNRTGILILTGVITAICLYFLSFTFVSRNIKSDAEAYATNKAGQVDRTKKQRYLDSLWKEPVYLGSTLQEVTERELGLGLDLQGGMHVVLEVSPADILRGLSGNNRDPKFTQALKQTAEDQKTSKTSFVDLFVDNYKELAPGNKLASVFATSANRGKINYQSSDTEVRKMLNDEVDGAIARAYQIIQARVDKFGVANPNIQRLPGSGRIQIELPGVDNPERVRRLLTGAAKLEFTEVYRLNELAPALEGMGAYLVAQEATRKAALGTATATTSGTATKGTSLESQLAQGAKKRFHRRERHGSRSRPGNSPDAVVFARWPGSVGRLFERYCPRQRRAERARSAGTVPGRCILRLGSQNVQSHRRQRDSAAVFPEKARWPRST